MAPTEGSSWSQRRAAISRSRGSPAARSGRRLRPCEPASRLTRREGHLQKSPARSAAARTLQQRKPWPTQGSFRRKISVPPQQHPYPACSPQRKNPSATTSSRPRTEYRTAAPPLAAHSKNSARPSPSPRILASSKPRNSKRTLLAHFSLTSISHSPLTRLFRSPPLPPRYQREQRWAKNRGTGAVVARVPREIPTGDTYNERR